MGLQVLGTPYGAPALAKLLQVVEERKRADPLAPVTIVTPNTIAGTVARRHLARAMRAAAGGHDRQATDGSGVSTRADAVGRLHPSRRVGRVRQGRDRRGRDLPDHRRKARRSTGGTWAHRPATGHRSDRRRRLAGRAGPRSGWGVRSGPGASGDGHRTDPGTPGTARPDCGATRRRRGERRAGRAVVTLHRRVTTALQRSLVRPDRPAALGDRPDHRAPAGGLPNWAASCCSCHRT